MLVTAFAVWCGLHAGPAWQERRAVAVLERHGCQWHSGGSAARSRFAQVAEGFYRLPAWLIWGERRITFVNVRGELDAELVDAISILPHLESLSLERIRMGPGSRHTPSDGAPLPPNALSRMLGDREIKDIVLYAWTPSDADCRVLANHKSLESVSLFASRLSDKGLSNLLSSPNLRCLGLQLVQSSDTELTALPGSESLETIAVFETSIGTEFAQFIGRSSRIRKLHLGGDFLDDEFMAGIGRHPSIEEMELHSYQLTDESAAAFAQMPSLSSVILNRGQLSADAVERLTRCKPNLLLHQLESPRKPQ